MGESVGPVKGTLVRNLKKWNANKPFRLNTVSPTSVKTVLSASRKEPSLYVHTSDGFLSGYCVISIKRCSLDVIFHNCLLEAAAKAAKDT